MLFDTKKEFLRRTGNTFILSEGCIGFVNTEEENVLTYKNEKKEYYEVRKYLKKEVRPPKLGYTNFKNKAYYLSRYPNRTYRLGLHRGNEASTPLKITRGLLIEEAVAALQYIQDNKYPSFEEAKKENLAFSQEYCIKNNTLFFGETKLFLLTRPRMFSESLSLFHRRNLKNLGVNLDIRLNLRKNVNPFEEDV